jgi:hypothetical protein
MGYRSGQAHAGLATIAEHFGPEFDLVCERMDGCASYSQLHEFARGRGTRSGVTLPRGSNRQGARLARPPGTLDSIGAPNGLIRALSRMCPDPVVSELKPEVSSTVE